MALHFGRKVKVRAPYVTQKLEQRDDVLFLGGEQRQTYDRICFLDPCMRCLPLFLHPNTTCGRSSSGLVC